MGDFDYLQPILGTGGKNKAFTVHKHSLSGCLHVYYGCELFEVVPDDREDMRYKLMVAHMYNVGAYLVDLQVAFKVDPRTIKRWSDALKSGDAETITKVFAGQKGGRKLTPPIEKFVRTRFPYMYQDDKYTYSSRMLEEINRIFETKLSSATLRPLFAELKAEFNREDPPDGDSGEADCDQPGIDSEPEADSENELCDPVPDHPSQAEDPDLFGENCDGGGEAAPNNRKECADFSTPQWSFHLGSFLFSESLLSLRDSMAPEFAEPVCQWATQTLLGAANLEQTKLLNGSDLCGIFGGKNLGGRSKQRERLGELSNEKTLPQDILRWNFDQVGGRDLSDFYYDPHTKHYTGTQNVLRGWCSKLRWADKIMIGDYIHTTRGQPVYLENCDNYEDMRQRFRGLEERFRSTLNIDTDRVLTWVIDRGIYGKEVFEWIVNQPNKHIITWEKNYKRDGWPEGKEADGSFKIQRTRNHSTDLRAYDFAWIEGDEDPAQPGLRRIIVRATNPNGNTIEVCVLCDEKERPAREIIWLIFDRWVQENDFKYMDSHFGINQITSYQSRTYEEIRDEVEDRMMTNAEYTSLELSRRDQKKKVGDLLYQQRESRKKEIGRKEQIRILERISKEDLTPLQKKELGRLKGGQRSSERYQEKREQKIKAREEEIDRLSAKMNLVNKEVSRLETLIDKGSVRLSGERKHLMDVIKLTSRNIFYKALEPFKEVYNNYRDDHVWFRHLSTSPGIIEETEAGKMKGRIIVMGDAPKIVRASFQSILKLFNDRCPKFPDQSDRVMELTLGSRSAFGITILKS